MNINQYVFMPQRSKIDSVMAVKDFAEKGLGLGELLVLVILDVKGDFVATW